MSSKLVFGFLLPVLFVAQPVLANEKCDEVYGEGGSKFSLATGSPGELGLLKALADPFTKRTNSSLCWKKAGSGESLKLLKEKAVDIIMVHAPAAAGKAVEEGWAANKTLIGSNEFYIVGPPGDPAKISAAKSAAEAYSQIAKAYAKFFSRGDNSGTHKKEMEIWKKADIPPSGDWYIVTQDFMTATLKRANDESGYFMTGSSTWVAEKNNVPKLTILFKGDKFLVNTYHALSQPGASLASKFIEHVASKEGQKIIAEYGKANYGEGIYNNAAYAARYD